MVDRERDVQSLSQFQRDMPAFLQRLRVTGRPIVLTVDGGAEVVVQDSASYQELLDRLDRAVRIEHLRASLSEMRAGATVPAEQVLAELREILAGPSAP